MDPSKLKPPTPLASPGQEPKLPSDGRQLLVVLGIVALSLLILGGAGWAILTYGFHMAVDLAVADVAPAPQTVATHEQNGSTGSFVPLETLNQRRTDLALAAGEIPPATDLTRDIAEFLVSVSNLRGDPDGIRQKIDRPRFIEEAARCGVTISDPDRHWKELNIPLQSGRLTVVQVRPEGKDQYRVIALLDDSENLSKATDGEDKPDLDKQRPGSPSEPEGTATGDVATRSDGSAGVEPLAETQRWWIVRRADGFKVYDWDNVDVGMRLSEYHAQSSALGAGDAASFLQKIDDACKHAESIRKRASEGWKDQLALGLKGSYWMLDKLPQPLREWKRRELAALTALGDPKVSSGLLQRCPHRDSHPFALWSEAQRWEERGIEAGVIPLYEKYLASVGESVAARRTLARHLWRAGESAKALAHWRRINQLRLADADALAGQYLCGDDVSDRVTVADRLASLPPDVLLDLGRRLQIHDLDVYDGFARACAERLPSSAAAWELIADGHELRGRLPEAAAAYLKSFEASSKEDAERRLNRYDLVMKRGNRLREAYLAAPDRTAAFERLMKLMEADGPSETFNDLLAARLEDRPDDPKALIHSALIVQADHRFLAAEKLWTLAIEAAGEDDSLAQLARQGRLWSLVGLGQWEGLVTEDSEEPTCQTIATALLRFGKWEELGEQTEGWIERFPKSSWAHALNAQVLENKGDLKKAGTSILKAYDLAETYEDAYEYRQMWIELALERGKPLEAWGKIPPLDESLDIACSILLENGNVDDLANLMLASKRHWDVQAAWHYWAPRYQFDNNHHDNVIKALDCNCANTLTGDRRVEAEALQVRSSLRLGQVAQARLKAVNLRDKQQSDYWPMHVAVVAREPLRVLQDVSRDAARKDWHQLYSDPDTSDVLANPVYSAIRETVPPRLSEYEKVSDLESVLFFSESHVLTIEKVQGLLDPVHQPQVEVVDQTGLGGAETCFLLKSKHGDFFISSGNMPAFKLRLREEWAIDEPNIRRDLSQHQSWISIRPARRTLDNLPWRLQVMRGMTFQLATVSPIARVWYDARFGFAMSPLKVLKLPPERLRAGFIASSCRRAGAEVHLPLGRTVSVPPRPDESGAAKTGSTATDPSKAVSSDEGAHSPEIDARGVYVRWKSLLQTQELRATVKIGHWTRTELLPLHIEAVRPTDVGWRILARPLQDSRSQPLLKAGTPLEIDPSEIQSLEVYHRETEPRNPVETTERQERKPKMLSADIRQSLSRRWGNGT